MLTNQTAVVTGGSRGLGRAIARKLAENGANIAILYAGNEAAADETCALLAETGVTAKAYRCDVSDYEATKAAVDQILADFGQIDILVNNAGITRDSTIRSMKEADFDAVIDTNLKGAFHMIKHCYGHFLRRRCGRIINITSVSGLMGNAGQANYSSAKAGMVGLTKAVAKELGGRGITCNAIAPGFIETDMTDKLSDKVKEAAVESIPLRHMGKPEDVANLALFLADEGASYITGEVIRVDGGLGM
ncbi:3-oxoacyl-[acyl-carrier-protein] reductase [Clostridium sp. D33t1_170424_F3]|uniref:3-oxoacyl-[acyl-carrier-protein] reductase n=1 Tax=Clostridium sp. D33t1_170424_F3 TaxID=2787099 RepID=UPI0018A99EF4|nr:3-oxoacyl-[acyl-carrier-protein] reductase [Clostridium sp. D33t1_170424_F3]